MEHRDTIVIGAGPAGLTAGIYLAHYGFDTLIFEEKILGGYAAEIPLLENFPGYSEGITGKDFTDKMVEQCKKNGAEIHQFEKVTGLILEGKKHIVKTDKSDYSAQAVIIASGISPKMLGVPGESQFHGKGVSYCAVCDGHFFKEKKVIIVGEDRRAVEVAIYLSGLASQAMLVCGKEKVSAEKILLDDLEKQKVELLADMELKEIKGDINVQSAVLIDKGTGHTKEIDTQGIFFQLEGIPNSQIAIESGVKIDKDDYILVDDKGGTNLDRLYAVGDIISSPTKLVLSAVSQAAVMALDVLEHIPKHI